MSLIVHKRELGEKVHELIKTNAPTFALVTDVMDSLGSVVSDMCGEPVRLVIVAVGPATTKKVPT